MRVICLSDTHGLHTKTEIPDGDLLIHAGDLTATGQKEDVIKFNEWLGTLPHPHKIVIAGNHDLYFESNPQEAKELLTNAVYLNDCSVVIQGLTIWGSPVSPAFHNWAFNRARGAEINEHWKLIPPTIDILVTHCPPAGILDKTDRGTNEGCALLAKRIEQQEQLRLHVFGHIHEAYGQVKIGNTIYVNASSVGLSGWIDRYELIKQIRYFALSIVQIVKRIYCALRPSRRRSTSKTLANLSWEIKHKPIVVDV